MAGWPSGGQAGSELAREALSPSLDQSQQCACLQPLSNSWSMSRTVCREMRLLENTYICELIHVSI